MISALFIKLLRMAYQILAVFSCISAAVIFLNSYWYLRLGFFDLPQASAGTAFAGVSGRDRISVRGHRFIDGYGRVRHFHGWNSVCKGSPWYFDQMLNDTRLDLLSGWGFNVVRLGTMWSGVEPFEDKFNETYVDILKTIVQKLRQRGIYVVMDMHQDGISSKFGSYDGVPRWLIDSQPASRHPFPWPLTERPSSDTWYLRYATEGVQQAFQNLYDNVAGSSDRMARFWRKVATEFRTTDTILAYELINEPWAGDMYAEPSLLVPGEAERRNLQPFYDRLNTAIREIDDTTIVFYEPTTWGIYLGVNGSYSGTGFAHVPGGPLYNNRSALSYHYYCWIMIGDASRPYPVQEQRLCRRLSQNVFANVVHDVQNIGGSLFLTEFGICVPDGQADSVNTLECESVLDETDKALQSWTYWDSLFFQPNGSVDGNVVKAFSRPYARAVAGTPLSMSFNHTTAKFSFKYSLDRGVQAPTEIYVSPMHYTKGKIVTVTDTVVWREDVSKRVIYIEPKKGIDEDVLYYRGSDDEIVDVLIVAKD